MTKKVSKADWVAHGFFVLKTKGHGALKADSMVRAMGVSRGSFYWHFKSVEAFEDAVLTAWRENITEAQIAELEDLQAAGQPLVELIRRVLDIPQELEAAVRAWAQNDARAAEAVAAVDALRIGFMAKVIAAAGVPADEARHRAVFLAWAYVGRAISPELVQMLGLRAAEDLGQLFLQSGLEAS